MHLKIVILGSNDDFQVSHVAASLQQHGADVLIFDSTRLGEDVSISWHTNKCEGVIHCGNKHWLFSEINACYWHKLSLQGQALTCKNIQALINLFLYQVNIAWINGLAAIRYHQLKPLQLAHAKALGALIPNTYVGNNHAAISKFMSTYKECIVKPVQGGVLAQCVSHEHQSQFLQSLNNSPFTFQEYISGTNIRTFVIGQQVVSAEIASDHIDYREDDGAQASVYELNAMHTELSLRLCRAFHMHWCAIDWRLNEKGELFFLEANPCPYFYHFEVTTEHPITRMLCDFITHVEHRGLKNKTA